MRCEECGKPGQPLCDDPDDPWPLCPDHIAQLDRRLTEAEKAPTMSIEEVLQVIEKRRRREAAQ